MAHLFFFDGEQKGWFPIKRTRTKDPDRPFNDVTLGFTKSLLVNKGEGNAKVTPDQVSEMLDAVLDRMGTAVLTKLGDRRLLARRMEEARQAARDRKGEGTTRTSSRLADVVREASAETTVGVNEQNRDRTSADQFEATGLLQDTFEQGGEEANVFDWAVWEDE